jgi:hypothetical protein
MSHGGWILYPPAARRPPPAARRESRAARRQPLMTEL